MTRTMDVYFEIENLNLFLTATVSYLTVTFTPSYLKFVLIPFFAFCKIIFNTIWKALK
jgi:hypothetical protein